MEINELLDYLYDLMMRFGDWLSNIIIDCTEEQEIAIVIGSIVGYIIFIVFALVKVPGLGQHPSVRRTLQKKEVTSSRESVFPCRPLTTPHDSI